jgi:hypothetical protein
MRMEIMVTGERIFAGAWLWEDGRWWFKGIGYHKSHQARVDAGLRRYGMDPEGSWEDGRLAPEKQEVVKEILRGLGEDE